MDNKTLPLLRLLVSFNSTYPGEKDMVDYIFKYLKEQGAEPEKQRVLPNRSNIIAEKGKGKTSVMLYGHLDTVGITENWKTDPLSLTVEGGRAYGLGAWDMKGSLSVLLNIFLSFQPRNYKLKLALCVDEENYSQGGYVLAGSSFLNDVRCIISPEPAFLHGLQGITTGRIGRAVYRLEITGKPYHFAHYHKSLDINLASSRIISGLRRMYKNNRLGKEFAFARYVHSQAQGMSLPGSVTLDIDTSVLPPRSHKEMLHNIKDIARNRIKDFEDGFKVKLQPIDRPTPPLESYKIKENNRYLKLLKTSVKEITSKPAVSYFRSSVADDNVYGALGKTVLGIGPEGGNAHAPNEWVSLSSLDKLQRILTDFLQRADM